MTGRLRIAHLIPDLGGGGAERVTVELACRQRTAGHEVALVSLFDHALPEFDVQLERAGIRRVRLGKRLGPDPRMCWRIGGALDDLRPDVVHSHRYALAYAMPQVVMRRRTAWVHTLHSLADREAAAVARRAHAFAFARGVAPVAIADEVAASCLATHGRAPAACIPNGIDLARFAAPLVPPGEWRARLGIGPAEIVFAFVGRLAPEKNLPRLIEAFAAGPLPTEVPVRLLIAGDGELTSALRDLIARMDIGGRVVLLGRRTDVADLLHAADVFVLFSHWEGHPLAVLEAMACQRAIVASRVGGTAGLLAQGRGLLVPPDDVPGMAAAMRALALDPELRVRLGSVAGAASRRYSAQVTAERYEVLYRRLIMERSAGRWT